MAEALLISRKDVVKFTAMNGNVDTDKFIQYIKIAQDIHIQNYLGTALYKKLMLLISNETITEVENQKYRDLLDDYIKPMLAWFTQAEFIPFAAYTISEGGMGKHRSENSDSLDRVEIAGLAARANDKASFYAERFIEFMCDNPNLFTEYNEGSQDMTPDKEVDSFGWFLG